MYNTEPACRAVVCARSLAPGKELDFFKDVQQAFYAKSQDPHLVESYFPICDAHGIDRAEFQQRWESDEAQYATRQDFQQAGNMGVRSFPTVAVLHNDSFDAIAIGYSTFEQMNAIMEKVVATVPE